MRPPITAMVAGTAPAARTSASTARAVSTFCGKGMPWVMMVDSSATTGAPAGPRRAHFGRQVQGQGHVATSPET